LVIKFKHRIYRSAAYLAENINRFVTRNKTCSQILKDDHFDNSAYTPDNFFEEVKPYFNKPELFYREFDTPASVQKISRNKSTGFDVYAFPSPFKTKWIENNTVYYRMFTKNKSDTILIFVPGWSRADLRAEENMCKQLLNNNIDTCLITKPFHQERTVANTYSGELFISGNIFLTIMNFRQLVAELRFLIHYFRKTYEYIGLIGMSSGGIQTALAADTEKVDFYFPLITGAKLGSITWEGKLTRFVKRDIIKKGLSEEQLNKAWAIADQYYLGSNCKAKHIKQFISLYDDVVPTKYQFLLWEIYNQPSLYKMHCGHVSVFFYFSRIVQEITKFIHERKDH
jgi:hypothetical protein